MAQKRKTLFDFGVAAQVFKSLDKTEPVDTSPNNPVENAVFISINRPIPFDPASADMIKEQSDYDKILFNQKFL